MKANELMVGDFVMMGKKNYRCVNICGHTNDVLLDNGVITNVGNLCPIPLIPEILEKNGFVIEEREGDPTFPYLAFIIDNDEYRIEITWYDQHEVYEPNTGEYLHCKPETWNMEVFGKGASYDCGKNKLHVHELQHVLRLFEIEKTIEL